MTARGAQITVRSQSIGDLATSSGVTVETLRFYERRGLIKTVGRERNGYRKYSMEATQLVRFIKRAQSLGFTLAEVGDLVQLRERGWQEEAGARLRSATVEKVRDIDNRIAALRELRKELALLIAQCDASCPAPVATTTKPERGSRTNGEPSVARDCALIDALEVDRTNKNVAKKTESAKPGRRFKPSTRKPVRPNKEKRP